MSYNFHMDELHVDKGVSEPIDNENVSPNDNGKSKKKLWIWISVGGGVFVVILVLLMGTSGRFLKTQVAGEPEDWREGYEKELEAFCDRARTEEQSNLELISFYRRELDLLEEDRQKNQDTLDRIGALPSPISQSDEELKRLCLMRGDCFEERKSIIDSIIDIIESENSMIIGYPGCPPSEPSDMPSASI